MAIGKFCPVVWSEDNGERTTSKRHQWRVLVRSKAEHVRADLVPFLPCRPEDRTRIQHITVLLARAETAAVKPSKLSDWWRGSLQEEAWSAIHQARVETIELPKNIEEVCARGRDVVLKARETLPKDDPRLLDVSAAVFPRRGNDHRRANCGNAAQSLLATLAQWLYRGHEQPTQVSPDGQLRLDELRPAVAYLAGAAYRQADKQYAESQSFRNRLIRLTGIALASDALVVLASYFGLFQLTVPGIDRLGVILLIALFGSIGAFLSGVDPLARNQGIRNPFNLPMYQLLLKLALGPLFAIVGVAMVTTERLTLDTTNPPLHLLVLATGFGMAQQVVTRRVDQRVLGLLAPGKAAPRHEAW